VVEQKLFVMYLEHRMRTFQGTFHASPDYAMWYGWSEMQRDLTEIKELAADMRNGKRRHGAEIENSSDFCLASDCRSLSGLSGARVAGSLRKHRNCERRVPFRAEREAVKMFLRGLL
jgi:hypothetical protein